MRDITMENVANEHSLDEEQTEALHDFKRAIDVTSRAFTTELLPDLVFEVRSRMNAAMNFDSDEEVVEGDDGMVEDLKKARSLACILFRKEPVVAEIFGVWDHVLYPSDED